MLMKVDVAGVHAAVCLNPGESRVPPRGTFYTCGSRELESVTMEVEQQN